ncbi:MAG: depupylase/deamidase Dop [Microthrixaceae bacterium]
MAIHKVLGIETEYGILVRGAPEQNPIAASSLVVNAYVTEVTRTGAGPRIGWDFGDEMPANDARGVLEQYVQPPDVETHLVNAVLTNGARFYVDHAHPEYSSPEVASARDGVVWDRAGEEVLRRAMTAANGLLEAGEEVLIHKNNSDGKGNSYGTHENYVMERATPFPRIVARATPHLVTRQVFCGAGKVGCELPGRLNGIAYQLSQRADFFEEEVGLETTLKRPIINTRDEPHADPQRYRRLHVIIGDANMSEWATWMKLATTAVVLAMIEDDWPMPELRPMHPVATLRRISWDLTLAETYQTLDGRTTTAVATQRELCALARAWGEAHDTSAVGGDVALDEVLGEWERVLDDLEHDRERAADRVDWVAKGRLLRGIAERHNLAPDSPRLRALDLQYHDLRPEKCLAHRAGLRTVVSPEEVVAAVERPPTDTRAWFRGTVLAKFTDQVVTANWDSIVFDTGSSSLSRVPMMEPLRGTEALLGDVVASSATAAELLTKLNSPD